MPRAMVFIDFWNFTLSIREYAGREYRLDYRLLPTYLCDIYGFTYEGAYLYAGIDPENENDINLKKFLINTVNNFPGYSVRLYDKKKAKDIHCKSCDQYIVECPHCSSEINRKVEKSVDVALVTDLLQFAWDDTYDVAFLASADSDFASAATFLRRRGKKVIQVVVGNAGRELAGACWERRDLRAHLDALAFAK